MAAFGWIGQFARDLRFGVRSLAQVRGFSAIAIGSLALGIGGSTAMYSVIHAVILDPFPYRDPDRPDERHGAGRARRQRQLLPDRPVSGYRATQYRFQRRGGLHVERRDVDLRGRTRAAARQSLHDEYVRGDGRGAAGGPRAGPGGRGRRRGAGDGAGLQVLAAAVRRRPGRAGAQAAVKRQGADGDRRDAAAIHVARRRRVPAGRIPSGRDGGGRTQRASVGPAEAGCDARAGIDRFETAFRGHGSRASGRFSQEMAHTRTDLRGDVPERHQGLLVDSVRRRRPAAGDRVRERVQPAVVEGRVPAARNRDSRSDGRRPIPDRAATAGGEPGAGAGRRCAGRGAGVCGIARHHRRGAAEHDPGRGADRAERAGAVVHAGDFGGGRAVVRCGSGLSTGGPRPADAAAGGGTRSCGRRAAAYSAKRAGGGGGGAFGGAAGGREPHDPDAALHTGRRSRVSLRPHPDAADSVRRAALSGCESTQRLPAGRAAEDAERSGSACRRDQHGTAAGLQLELSGGGGGEFAAGEPSGAGAPDQR